MTPPAMARFTLGLVALVAPTCTVWMSVTRPVSTAAIGAFCTVVPAEALG